MVMGIKDSRDKSRYNGIKSRNIKMIIIVMIALLIVVGVSLSLFFVLRDKDNKDSQIIDNKLVTLLANQMTYTLYEKGEMQYHYETLYYDDGKRVITENGNPKYLDVGSKITAIFIPRIDWVHDLIGEYKGSVKQEYKAEDYEYHDGTEFGLWKYKDIQKYKYDIYGNALKLYIEGRLKAGAEIKLVIEDYNTSEIYMTEIDGKNYRFIVTNNYIIMGEYTEKEIVSLDKYCNYAIRELTSSEIEKYTVVINTEKANE